jgi:hypothetical protein
VPDGQQTDTGAYEDAARREKIIGRFLMSVGAVTVAPAPLLPQEQSGISISDVCSKPEYAAPAREIVVQRTLVLASYPVESGQSHIITAARDLRKSVGF